MQQTNIKLNVLNLVFQIVLIVTYLYFTIALWEDVFKGSVLFFLFFAIIPFGDALALLTISFINLGAKKNILNTLVGLFLDQHKTIGAFIHLFCALVIIAGIILLVWGLIGQWFLFIYLAIVFIPNPIIILFSTFK